MDSIKSKLQEIHISERLKKIDLNHRLKKIDVFVMLVVFFITIISFIAYVYLQQEIYDDLLLYGALGLFAITFFLELIPQFVAPHIFIPLSISAGVNPHIVLISAVVGSTFGSILGFHLGQKYGLAVFIRFLKQKRVDAFLHMVARSGKIAVFVSAISPFPYLPIVFGSLGVSWRSFLLYGIFSRAIGFAVIAYGFYLGFFRMFII